jgi:hypothetical protein
MPIKPPFIPKVNADYPVAKSHRNGDAIPGMIPAFPAGDS